jgi:tellurite resistance protein
LRIAESDEIEAFTDRHHWESPTFSLSQALGPATAKVRRALDSVLAVNALIADIDHRVTHARLRAEVVDACYSVARADGEVSAEEQALLDKISARLGK